MFNTEQVPLVKKVSENVLKQKRSVWNTLHVCSASIHTQKAMEAEIQRKAGC